MRFMFLLALSSRSHRCTPRLLDTRRCPSKSVVQRPSSTSVSEGGGGGRDSVTSCSLGHLPTRQHPSRSTVGWCNLEKWGLCGLLTVLFEGCGLSAWGPVCQPSSPREALWPLPLTIGTVKLTRSPRVALRLVSPQPRGENGCVSRIPSCFHGKVLLVYPAEMRAGRALELGPTWPQQCVLGPTSQLLPPPPPTASLN